jgi:hypothetical protein
MTFWEGNVTRSSTNFISLRLGQLLLCVFLEQLGDCFVACFEGVGATRVRRHHDGEVLLWQDPHDGHSDDVGESVPMLELNDVAPWSLPLLLRIGATMARLPLPFPLLKLLFRLLRPCHVIGRPLTYSNRLMSVRCRQVVLRSMKMASPTPSPGLFRWRKSPPRFPCGTALRMQIFILRRREI